MAATNVINVQPQVLNLMLYAGDGFKARLTCKDPEGDPVDMNGTIRAQIRLSRAAPDPPLASFVIGVIDAYQGIIVISLTGAQTKSLMDHASGGRFVGVWDLEWDSASDEPRTLCQGTVECVYDVTE